MQSLPLAVILILADMNFHACYSIIGGFTRTRSDSVQSDFNIKSTEAFRNNPGTSFSSLSEIRSGRKPQFIGQCQKDSLSNVDLHWNPFPVQYLKPHDNPRRCQGFQSLRKITKLPIMPFIQDNITTISPRYEEGLEGASMGRLLTSLILQNLDGCHLVIITDNTFKDSLTLKTLIRLPLIKQLIFIEESESLLVEMEWLTPICQGILLLLRDSEPLLNFGSDHLFSWDYRARFIIAGLEKEDILRFIETKKGKKSENIIAVLEEEKTGEFTVYMNELYWGDRGLRLMTKWNGQEFTKTAVLYPDKISDLQEAELNLAHFEWKPAIFYKRDQEGIVIRRYGRDIYVVYALAEAFNFTLVYKETNLDELFGQRLPNGSFNGQVGQMYNGEGDLGIANLWLSSLADRHKFQAFSSPFEVDNSCCMARVEPPLPLWQSPALPFQPHAWIAILFGTLFSGPILYGFAKASSMIEQEDQNLQSLSSSILYSVGVIISHPMAVLPKNPTTQVYIVFFLLYGLILNTGYTSNLISFLTVPKQPYSFETFRELYDNGIIFVGIPYLKDALKFSNNPYLSGLAKTYDVRMTFEELTEDILAGRAVSMNSKTYLEFAGGILATSNKKSKYRMMKECFAFYSVGLVYQKHSPLKNKFDLMITRLFESGMVRKWFVDSIKLYYQYEREEAKKQLQDGKEDLGETQESGVLRLAHVQGVFILMLLGMLLSAIVFVVEILIS